MFGERKIKNKKKISDPTKNCLFGHLESQNGF